MAVGGMAAGDLGAAGWGGSVGKVIPTTGEGATTGAACTCTGNGAGAEAGAAKTPLEIGNTGAGAAGGMGPAYPGMLGNPLGGKPMGDGRLGATRGVAPGKVNEGEAGVAIGTQGPQSAGDASNRGEAEETDWEKSNGGRPAVVNCAFGVMVLA